MTHEVSYAQPRQFKVSTSCHQMNCVEESGLSKLEMMAIKSIVTNNLINTDDYRLGRAAGVFLQGYEESHGWILIEFWQQNYQPFVDHLNSVFAERVNFLREIYDEDGNYR